MKPMQLARCDNGILVTWQHVFQALAELPWQDDDCPTVSHSSSFTHRLMLPYAQLSPDSFVRLARDMNADCHSRGHDADEPDTRWYWFTHKGVEIGTLADSEEAIAHGLMEDQDNILQVHFAPVTSGAVPDVSC